MTKETVVVSARVDKATADRLMKIAEELTVPGEKVKISVAVRDAVRQYLAARVS